MKQQIKRALAGLSGLKDRSTAMLMDSDLASTLFMNAISLSTSSLGYVLTPRTMNLYYSFLARYISRRSPRPFAFRNLGFAELEEDTSLALDASEEPYRYHIQLYHRVARLAELADTEILEVSCGLGGGTDYLARRFAPRKITGLDLSEEQIRQARAWFTAPNLRWTTGSADALPFPAASFDRVINVEASHCYASMVSFLGEVHRVLRPGGYLLYADFRRQRDLPRLYQELTHSGLALRERWDITRNVVRARDLEDTDGVLDGLNIAPKVRLLLKEFFVAKDSYLYSTFTSGHFAYVMALLQKPEERLFQPLG